MKLGVSYNVFGGEELLECFIRSVRENVDHVSVVYPPTDVHETFGTRSEVKIR